MTVGTFFWHVVLPAERQNLISNPSFELGTAGWSGTVASAFGTASAGQAFGAWAGTVRGASDFYGCWHAVSLGSGSAYTASAHVRIVGAAAGSVQLRLGGGTTNVGVGSAWTRITAGTSTTAAGNTYVQIMANSATGGTLWVDGVQVESGSVTTYVDGDQEGCQWLGAPHASLSYRGGQVRAGGSVIPLAALGLRAETSPGAGVAPPVNLAQGRAALDGAEYQRTRYDVRELVLTATLTGTATPDMHLTRRRVFDAITASRVTPQQPVRLLYTGAGSTVALDAVYAGGLEMTETGVIDDKAAVRFSAFEPAWHGPYDQGTALAPYTVLGSVNHIAARDPLGRWGTFGVNGTTVWGGAGGTIVYAIRWVNGTVFVGGQFFRAGGTVAHMVAQYAGGAWGTLPGGQLGTAGAGGGTAVAAVRAIRENPGGTLFVGGVIDTTVAGTAIGGLALHLNGAWGSTSGGTIQGYALGLDLDPLSSGMYVAGAFSAAGGTTINGVARWAGAWGTLPGGTITTAGAEAVRYQNGTVFVAGAFLTVGGGSAYGMAQYSGGSVGTIIGAAASLGTSFRAVAAAPDQRVYAAGLSAARPRVLRPGGLGTLEGIRYEAGGAGQAILALPDGDVLFAGNGLKIFGGSVPLSIDIARWNGYTALPVDLRSTTNSLSNGVYALEQSPDGTLYIGGGFAGIGTAAAVAPVVNTGMSDAYPLLRVRNTGAGTARIYQLLNATTGDDLYFNLVALPGEYITLDLTPGGRAFTSSARGNLISTILGGSNLATWRLQPGTNWVSFFADGAGIRADLYWRPRHESADGGAEPTL